MVIEPKIPKDILDEIEAIPEECRPQKPFTTDGCSGGMSWVWRKVLKEPPPWEGCCVRHDFAYLKGGSWSKKYFADKLLMNCVWKKGYRLWAILIFLSVSFYGVRWLPTPFRWGYGWKYPYACDHESHLDK